MCGMSVKSFKGSLKWHGPIFTHSLGCDGIENQRKEWNEEEKDYLLEILSNYNQLLLSKRPNDKIFIINFCITIKQNIYLWEVEK